MEVIQHAGLHTARQKYLRRRKPKRFLNFVKAGLVCRSRGQRLRNEEKQINLNGSGHRLCLV